MIYPKILVHFNVKALGHHIVICYVHLRHHFVAGLNIFRSFSSTYF